MAYIGRQNLGGAYRQLDDISSGFDGSDTTHTMQVNSQNVTVGDVNQIILSLGGVIQKPGTDFTVSGSVLTFTTAPAANTSFFAVLLGSDNGGTTTPTDLSVSTSKIAANAVTGAKLASDIAITTSGDVSFDGGSFVFNESSADKDFRIETNGNANMLFVSGGNDVVGVGAEGDLGVGLHVKSGDSGASVSANADELVIESATNGGLTILTATDGQGNIFFGDSGDNDVAQIDYNHSSNTMFFLTANGEEMRINAGVSIGGNAEDDSTMLTVKSGGDQTMISAQSTKSDYGGYVIRADAERGATVSYGLFDALSGNLGDREFFVRGDGNVYADGSFSGSGADYAEFFETKTGSTIAVGTTVVLEDNKVRASTDSDAASTIIGVVRPKSDAMMKASMVIGNCAWNHWSQKYETDDYDAFVTEEFTITEWTETDYNTEHGKPSTKEVWYETDKIPSDVTAPTEDVKDSDGRVIKTKAVVKTTEIDGTTKLIRKKVNSNFDKSKEYSPREKRDEWVIVGLLGQVPINKGQKTGDRWIKMRDKSDTVEEWYIR
jgi:hypothetical protein